jgi:hypothetical protein
MRMKANHSLRHLERQRVDVGSGDRLLQTEETKVWVRREERRGRGREERGEEIHKETERRDPYRERYRLPARAIRPVSSTNVTPFLPGTFRRRISETEGIEEAVIA